MSVLTPIIRYLTTRLKEARKAPPSEYRDGSIAELEELKEFIEDYEWREGLDEDEPTT